jgi:hypothetical protein
MRVLSRITIPENVTAPSPSSAVPQEPNEEDQSTIESFLEEKAD